MFIVQSSPPVTSSSKTESSKPPQTAPSTRNQVFKCPGLWRTCLIQASTYSETQLRGWKRQLLRGFASCGGLVDMSPTVLSIWTLRLQLVAVFVSVVLLEEICHCLWGFTPAVQDMSSQLPVSGAHSVTPPSWTLTLWHQKPEYTHRCGSLPGHCPHHSSKNITSPLSFQKNGWFPPCVRQLTTTCIPSRDMMSSSGFCWYQHAHTHKLL